MTTQASMCMICNETVNKSTHTLVTCQYCPFEACRACCETYILSQSTSKCMEGKCGKEWTRKFLAQNFSKSFINGPLKKHTENVMFDKEVALLPSTQIIIEAQLERERIKKEVSEVQQLIDILHTKKNELLVKAGRVVEKKEITFVRTCPAEECRGFLSSQWKCGMCELFTCSKCHVIKNKTNTDDDHVCNPDNVATALLLNSDTKSCPKCYTGIFKIEGCDQMWCTQCHTAFSWKTGAIETRIHNPHYYEWQRRNGGVVPRERGDVVCGRELTHRMEAVMTNTIHGNRIPFVKDGIKSIKISSDEMLFLKKIREIIPSLIHLRYNDMDKYVVDNVHSNLGNRIMYMRNRIDKETFQYTIFKNHKAHEKKCEIYGILQMFTTATTDILFRIHDSLIEHTDVFNSGRVVDTDTKVDKHDHNEWKKPFAEFKQNENERIVMRSVVIKNALDTLNEIDAIREYSNECLLEVSHTYGCQVKHIDLEERVDGHRALHAQDVLRNIPIVPKKDRTGIKPLKN